MSILPSQVRSVVVNGVPKGVNPTALTDAIAGDFEVTFKISGDNVFMSVVGVGELKSPPPVVLDGVVGPGEVDKFGNPGPAVVGAIEAPAGN